MGLLGIMRRAGERLTGTRILRRVPRGLDPLHDVATALPGYRVEVVLDVGANIGQSAAAFVAAAPGARVHCFEPVSTTFRTLESRARTLPGVSCHRLALADAVTTARITTDDGPESLMNHLVDDGDASSNECSETVDVSTVDRFLDEQRIDHVSYLKIDTEGHDLAVLQGAAESLRAGRIDFVEVEAGMHDGNDRHVPFGDFVHHLEACGYRVFGLYDQTHEWTTGAAHLRRVNPVFISPRLAAPPSDRAA